MKALRYAKRLVGFDSVSHRSNRLISKYLEMKLTKHGFVVEKIDYRDKRKVRKTNLVAKKGGGHGGLAYFAHSDVVPAKKWFNKKFGPFEPAIARERLYGRGSCDMKGSIACMLTAGQQFAWDDLKQPLYFVVTADEEVGFHGAKCVVEESKLYREMVQYGTKAIIGEPTSLEVVHAHKGSVEIEVRARGVAGHSGSRQGVNANLKMIPFLGALKELYDETESHPQWQNELFDPPTMSINIRLRDDSPALNVTASKSICSMYLRTMPGVDEVPIVASIEKAAHDNGLDIRIARWGDPFFADPESEFVQQSLKLAHRPKSKTVSYGTDGGVFSEIGDKIVFGPGSIAQAHTRNEWIALEQLTRGTEMYAKMIRHWCCK
jgi:acetylornithine deacetylase